MNIIVGNIKVTIHLSCFCIVETQQHDTFRDKFIAFSIIVFNICKAGYIQPNVIQSFLFSFC